MKNNLAVICSLFYLQSTHTKDEETVQIFRDMERRVHSMALVHESLYGSENLACIDFAEYAHDSGGRYTFIAWQSGCSGAVEDEAGTGDNER